MNVVSTKREPSGRKSSLLTPVENGTPYEEWTCDRRPTKRLVKVIVWNESPGLIRVGDRNTGALENNCMEALAVRGKCWLIKARLLTWVSTWNRCDELVSPWLKAPIEMNDGSVVSGN